MAHRTDLPLVQPFVATAHYRDACDVCFGTSATVRHLSVPEAWLDPDTRQTIDLMNWYTVYLCDACSAPDGGLVSVFRLDGTLVLRTGTASPWPRRLIIISLDVRH